MPLIRPNSVHCGDCLDLMDFMPDNSVDLIFDSPPYENRRSYGNLKFNLTGEAWVDWMVQITLESLRICKGLVATVVEGPTKNYRWSATPALLMADLHRQGVHLRKPPIYARAGIPGSGGPDWLANRYESIVCCTKGGRLPWSDNTAMGHPPKFDPGGEMSYRLQDGKRRNAGGRTNGTDLHVRGDGKDGRTRQQYIPPKIANPGNIINLGAVGGGNIGDDLAHETEAPFPEKLAEFFIRSFCPSGGIVLDRFSGSGTTAAVAKKLGRRYIAFDIRKDQCRLTERRLASAAPLRTHKDVLRA